MAKRQRTNNHLEVEVEDTTGAIRIRKSKKDRQCSGQKKKIKRTNNGLQNTTHETKDPSTRTTPLNTRCELKCSGRVFSSCFTVYIVGCGKKDLYQRLSWDRVARTPQINYIEASLALTLNIEGVGGVKHHFQQYFSYIVGVRFIGGGNRSIRRKQPTYCKSLTNFITQYCIKYTSLWTLSNSQF